MRSAWTSGLTLASLSEQDLARMSGEPPSLEEVKTMFEALQEGMELPAGITWDQIEAEAEQFHAVMAKEAGSKRIRRWWGKMWNANRFSVLELCFLKWMDSAVTNHIVHDSHAKGGVDRPQSKDDTSSKDNVSSPHESVGTSFFEELLGSELGGIVGSLVRRISTKDTSFADSLEDSIQAMVEGKAKLAKRRPKRSDQDQTGSGPDPAGRSSNSLYQPAEGVNGGVADLGLLRTAAHGGRAVGKLAVRSAEADEQSDTDAQQLESRRARYLETLEELSESLQRQQRILFAHGLLLLTAAAICCACHWASAPRQQESIWL